MVKRFEHLIIIGRPACGKSELIDYLKSVSVSERVEKFHIGKFEEIDDFPWLWEKFKDDDIWEKLGCPRLYSKNYMPGNPHMTPGGTPLFDFCMEKFNVEIANKYLSKPDFYKDNTLFIEFSRGATKTYTESFALLSQEILEKAVILFIDVTKDESWRRNVERYEEKKKHSILSHSLPKETYDFHYSTHDWLKLTGDKSSGYLEFKKAKVPFVTMNNEPQLPPGQEIAKRYRAAFDTLFKLLNKQEVL